jgi:hypothetical protein
MNEDQDEEVSQDGVVDLGLENTKTAGYGHNRFGLKHFGLITGIFSIVAYGLPVRSELIWTSNNACLNVTPESRRLKTWLDLEGVTTW